MEETRDSILDDYRDADLAGGDFSIDDAPELVKALAAEIARLREQYRDAVFESGLDSATRALLAERNQALDALEKLRCDAKLFVDYLGFSGEDGHYRVPVSSIDEADDFLREHGRLK